MANICPCCQRNVARAGLDYCIACGCCELDAPCGGDSSAQIEAMMTHGGHDLWESAELVAAASQSDTTQT